MNQHRIPRPAHSPDEISRLRSEMAAAQREIERLNDYVKVCDKALHSYREATSQSREQR
jgi:hypothetical protein